MYDYNALYELIEKVIHKYSQYEKQIRQYTDKGHLTQTEVHTIACIGDNPGLNMTKLASLKGISKSAASQMIGRLRSKGLVDKSISKNSEAEVVITLTSAGCETYEMHRNYHKNHTGELFTILKAIPEHSAEDIEKLLNQVDNALDHSLKK